MRNMDRISKLFRKISKEERIALLALIEELRDPAARKRLNIKKLRGSEFYRAREGRFRIIFHIESARAVIDSIRLRDKNTYRDF